MRRFLTDSHHARHEAFKAFVACNVAAFADRWDRAQELPSDVIDAMAQRGYLGAGVPQEFGGQEWDTLTFGLLNEAFGRASSALTGVITVQSMVSMSLLKWGTPEQRRRWLPDLANGAVIGAFAVTEPGAGSATQSLATTLTECAGGFALNGTKRWISCGQFAGVFLVFGKLRDQPVACLVPRETPGVRVERIDDLMGFRAAGLAELHFDDVRVPATDLVGRPGFALSHVAPVGLHYGRISTACSALGLLRGCFEESIAYAATRSIGDKRAGDIGMVRSLIAHMGADLAASAGLCHRACWAEDERAPAAFEHALVAKYFTSRAATRAASDAVQIRGASGCHAGSPVSRFYRDAKVMEIIEGTTQVHEDLLGGMFVAQASAAEECAD